MSEDPCRKASSEFLSNMAAKSVAKPLGELEVEVRVVGRTAMESSSPIVSKGCEYKCAPIVCRFPSSGHDVKKVELYASKDHLQSKDCYVVARTSKGK